MKKTYNSIGAACLIFALLFILTSCSSIYEHMPETTGSDTAFDPDEEYFTTGEVVSFAATELGIAYEETWIYAESFQYVLYEDNPNTPIDETMYRTVERLVKYNPVTDTVSSPCLDPTCLHSGEECPFYMPHTWMLTYFDLIGDWLLFSYADVFADYDYESGWDLTRNYLYHMKTGEIRQIHTNTKEGDFLSQSNICHVMNGKIYCTRLELDYTGKAEHDTSDSEEEFEPETHQFVEVYDPETHKIERLCEIPDDLYMIAITNKRFFYSRGDGSYCSTDYKGENLKTLENFRTPYFHACGKYAYFSDYAPEYDEEGYNIRGYDLATDSIIHINFGCHIRNILIDSGKLGFTTFSRIEEFKEFVKNRREYVKDMYPDVTHPEEIAKLQLQVMNSIQYDGTFQLYVTDALGNNKELVFEGENMYISPLRMAGNYLFGYVSYADPNNNYEVTYPGNNGRCVLNLETGEITLIPQLELYID